MAFRGHFEHSLDAKNRLSIPARFRAAFADGVVLSKDSDACLAAWSPETLEANIDQALEGKNRLGRESKKIQRFFQSNSFDIELDSAGRVTLPQALIDHAGIAREVVVAGVGDHLEIWEPARWSEAQEALDAEIGEVTEALGDPS